MITDDILCIAMHGLGRLYLYLYLYLFVFMCGVFALLLPSVL